jgi:4-amino-4-deoxy-L-arabinose transferase-like glycosyltransferase
MSMDTTRRRSAATQEDAAPKRRNWLRRTFGRVPAAAWICAAIAVVNGVCWAATTPAYWAPDEIAGIGYVQYVAENGDIPRIATGGDFSEEQFSVPFTVEGRPPWLEVDQRNLFRQLERPLERTRRGQAYYLSTYPPLYYAVDAIPYRIAYNANFLDRIFAMRLLSPLLAGLTVLFVFLFVREVLPGRPWAWTLAGLAVAFQPMFGFMSGAVNNDNLLYAASAALFFLVARAFRRGLDTKLGVAIGLTVAVGLLTKQTIAGLLPGVALGMALIVWTMPSGTRRPAVRAAAVAAGLGLLPWVGWLLVSNVLLDRAVSDIGGATSTPPGWDLSGMVSYIWQSVLPPLPFMTDWIPWYPPWEAYFKGFIGSFGWVQYSFSLKWHYAALGLYSVLVVLAAVELWRSRAVVRRRWAEALTYVTMFAGLLLLIEYLAFKYHVGLPVVYFEQGRYLLPLLARYGAFVALAARGAGRKWGPAVGAFLIVLAMGHSLFAQLLTISRFFA